MLRRAVKYLDEDYKIGLKTYRIFRLGNQKYPVFSDVITKRPELYEEPTTCEDHIDYVRNEALKKYLEEIIDQIKHIGDDITVEPRKYWLAFLRRGRRFAVIETARQWFDLSLWDRTRQD